MAQDTTTLYLAAGGLLVAYAIITSFILPIFSTQSKFLRSHPWTGLQKQWFSTYRAGISSVLNTRSMVLEGYEKFSKHGKLFVLPQLNRDPFVVLPADKVHEFLTQGDDKLDPHAVTSETVATKWTMHVEFTRSASHFDVVRRQLTRKLPLLTADVHSELVLAMEQQWQPKADSWTVVKIYPTCMKIVSRAANRVFSGKELCRIPEYLDHSRLYAMSVFKTGGLLKLLPDFFHPIAGRILMRDVNANLAVCRKYSVPVIKRRMQQMKELGRDYKPENDVLQWILDEAVVAPKEKAFKRDPDFICRVLVLLNMVAIHTTSMVMSNTLMDLYTSPSKDDFLAGLREECERVLREHGGQWSKDAINQLYRVDSTIRETMRVSGLGDVSLPRLVTDPKGINLSGGIHIPQGIRVAIPSYAIHHDDSFYSDANQWDAFRFSRPREDYMASKETDKSPEHLDKVLDLKNRGLIVTTDDFFSFGFGRHACPGRFFASQEMKLMLAHIVLNYDIDIKGPRPQNMLINGASVPKDSIEMKIRQRQSPTASA